MKINTLLEYTSPSSQPNQSGGQAPEFGRDPNVLETTAGATGSGSIGASATAMPGMQRRNSKGSMFQGIKTSKKFVNSPVTEDEISEEQLLTKQLRRELFKRAKDRDIGNRPEDHDIMSKESDPEYDDEAGMVTTNLHTALRAIEGLDKVIGPNENLPEWVQEKIAIANDYLVTCWDYMISQHEQGRKYEVDEASSDKYFMPGGGASFGRRERDPEYHVPDPVDPNTLPYNVKVNGQVINERPLPGRQAAIQWAKEKVNAGEIDPKLTTIAPVPKMSEVAPPGAKAERMVKHIKKSYSKDGKITPKEKSIAYATAWKAHNKGKVEEQGVAEGTSLGNPVYIEGCSWDDVVDWLEKNVGPTTVENPNWMQGWFGKNWQLYPASYSDENGRIALQVSANTKLTKDTLKSEIEKACKQQGVAEESKGLWANIHAKRERIKQGSGERMRKPGSKGAPTKDALRKSAK
jgi:hypothetical protein